MKQEKASLTSSASLFMTLLCFIGVLHVEYKLYTHEVFMKEGSYEKTTTTAEVQQLLKKHDKLIKNDDIHGKIF